MKRFSTKQRIAAAVISVAMVAAGAGAAFAYFTGGGTGTGQASVGSTNGSTDWTVAQSGSASGNMLPGYGSSTVTFTATNAGNGDQGIDGASQVAVAMVKDGSGNVKANGSVVSGCLASWFTPTLNAPPVPAYGTTVASGHTYTFTVTVTMSSPAGVNQDLCKSVTPDVSMTISHS